MFNEEEMEAWTSSCDRNEGEIFRWSASHTDLTQPSNSPLNVTFIKKTKSEVCPDPNKQQKRQEPSKLGSKSRKTRYKLKFTEGNPTFVGKVIEVISDPFLKSPLDSKDRCL